MKFVGLRVTGAAKMSVHRLPKLRPRTSLQVTTQLLLASRRQPKFQSAKIRYMLALHVAKSSSDKPSPGIMGCQIQDTARQNHLFHANAASLAEDMAFKHVPEGYRVCFRTFNCVLFPQICSSKARCLPHKCTPLVSLKCARLMEAGYTT